MKRFHSCFSWQFDNCIAISQRVKSNNVEKCRDGTMSEYFRKFLIKENFRPYKYQVFLNAKSW